MVEASTHLPEWRKAIVDACSVAITEQGWEKALGACRVEATFFLPKPKTSKLDLPIKMPDVDKLSRASLDSLTMAGVWGDDSQCVDLVAMKRFGNPGVCIRVIEV